MKCPECGFNGKLYIKDMRHREWGFKRIRQCPNCQYRFATVEVCEIEKDKIKEIKHSLDDTQYLIDCKSNSERIHKRK